jgi:hypothetical protein
MCWQVSILLDVMRHLWMTVAAVKVQARNNTFMCDTGAQESTQPVHSSSVGTNQGHVTIAAGTLSFRGL